MVESAVFGAVGVTNKAGLTIKFIAWHTIVFILKFAGIIMLVTLNAGKLTVIVRVFMAIRAIIPFAFVVAAVYGEKGIVIVKFGGRPPGVGRVALATINGKAKCLVVGRFGCFKRILVAGKTVRGGIGKIGGGMTGVTIRNIVAFGEREEVVQNLVG